MYSHEEIVFRDRTNEQKKVNVNTEQHTHIPTQILIHVHKTTQLTDDDNILMKQSNNTID